jgi:hypothetical protein
VKLTEGVFKAKPVSAILRKTSTGKDSCEIVLAFYDGSELSHVERSAWVYFSPVAFDRAIETLRTCGWTGDDLSDMSMISVDTSPDVEAVLGEEEYEGKVRLKVKFINPWKDRTPREPLSHDAARSFAELMKEKVRAADAANAERAAKRGAAVQPF